MIGELSLQTHSFPSFERGVRARWAPVLLEPIAGSYERLVVGVAVVSPEGFHVERANALERLQCLYADAADAAIYAIDLMTECLARDLAARAERALREPADVISGITLGECRDAEGESLQAIGESWMRILSSLYRSSSSGEALQESIEEGLPQETSESPGPFRLPARVLEYVAARRQGLEDFFDSSIQSRRQRRRKGRSYEVVIHYSSSKLVANFGEIKANELPKSIMSTKNMLWDLGNDRARRVDLSYSHLRKHEMILRVPGTYDLREANRVGEAVAALTEQADQAELRLRTLPSVEAIGDYVLNLEAA